MEEQSIHNLPPSKRFKLLHHQHDPPPLTPSSCLPAKKRIWAPRPLSPIMHRLQPGPIEEASPTEDSRNPTKGNPTEEKTDEDEDDGITCAVCRSTDADPSNPIVFCDGCDLTVHASCYGNPLAQSIPEGDWFCQRCTLKDEGGVSGCCLCPKKGGALKPTVDNRWAHILCALFVPEVYFKDSEGRDGIDCEGVPRGKRELECYLCGCRSGRGIQCAEIGCGLGFHVTCGVEEGLSVELREGRNIGGGGIVAGFCGEHTKLWKKQQLTGKFKIVARESNSKRKPKD